MGGDRGFDIVLFGVTGFTGKFVAEHLFAKGPEHTRIAFAGRSRSKLEAVRDSLAATLPEGPRRDRVERVSLLIADSSDQESLDAVAAATRVVITTVGPFLKYGKPLVDACVRHGTDYIDSTGESSYIKSLIDEYEEAAMEKKVRIIPSCGFDSLPSDLGALLLADHFAKLGKKTDNVRCVITTLEGSVSGGTLHSGMGMVETSTISELVGYQYSLVSKDDPTARPKLALPLPTFLRYNRDIKRYETAWFMEMTNSPYVRRSWALLSKKYGPQFKYYESMGLSSYLIPSLVITLSLWLAFAFVMLPPARWIIKKIVPAGSGPSTEACKNGRTGARYVGTAEDGTKALAVFDMKADAGYAGTGILLSESALAIIEDGEKLERNDVRDVGSFGVLKGGILTGGSALGLVLVERLKKQGIQFEVEN